MNVETTPAMQRLASGYILHSLLFTAEYRIKCLISDDIHGILYKTAAVIAGDGRLPPEILAELDPPLQKRPISTS